MEKFSRASVSSRVTVVWDTRRLSVQKVTESLRASICRRECSEMSFSAGLVWMLLVRQTSMVVRFSAM